MLNSVSRLPGAPGRNGEASPNADTVAQRVRALILAVAGVVLEILRDPGDFLP